MSLPIIIVYERHWDVVPRLIVQELLPDLAQYGYSQFCIEAPQDLSESQIIECQDHTVQVCEEATQQAEMVLRKRAISTNLPEMSFSALHRLLNENISTQSCMALTQKIKFHPANKVLKKAYALALEHKFALKGIDIDSEEFFSIRDGNPSATRNRLDQSDQKRIITHIKHLESLKAPFFLCGSLHAEAQITKLANREVLYYFPHSEKRLEERMDDIQMVANNTVLEGHTHLVRQTEVTSFKEKILGDLFEKLHSRKHPEGNSQSHYLTALFKANFTVFSRVDHFADILLEKDSTPDSPQIEEKLKRQNIPVHTVSILEKKYLVILNVNTKIVADRLFKIKKG